MTSSITKVSDIASNLLNQTQDIQKDEAATRKKADLGLILWDAVNFKQNQYGTLVNIQSELDQVSPSIPLNHQDLERAVHNLIDNAVEASSDKSVILLTLRQIDQMACIQLIDSGKGIPKESLARLGTRGFTFGKVGGTGLGLFYAKQFVESIGGSLHVKSEVNIGTTVSLFIPTSETKVDEVLNLKADESLLVLDDQETIREQVHEKFAMLKSHGLRLKVFASILEMEDWMVHNRGEFFLVSDYYLQNESDEQCDIVGSKKETGLDVIKRLGIENKSMIFTSAYEDKDIQLCASSLGVRLLSKEQFFEMQFIFDDSMNNKSSGPIVLN